MAQANLPARPNLDYLKKLAKERLRSLRKASPNAKLTAAQLLVAREHGFSSWRLLHACVQSLEKDKPTQAQIRAFLEAISKPDVAMAERLLREKPSLASATTDEGWTPLHAAAEHNQVRIIEMLVAAGADVEAMMGQYKHNALSWAVTCHAFDAARALTRLGVKPDLFSAAGMGDAAAIPTFFDDRGNLRPNPSKTGSSRYDEKGQLLPSPPTAPEEIVADALCIAARSGHAEAVRVLLQHQPQLGFRAYLGATPLHWAYFSGSREIVQLLLSAGADPALRDATYKCRPRAFGICVASSWGILPLVREMLKGDPTLAKVSDEPTSPLHEAANAGHLGIVALLLLAGADPDARNAAGKTPAQVATENGHAKVAAALAPRWARINPEEAAGRAVKSMKRAWAESQAIIEQRTSAPGTGPRWEAVGVQSPTLLEKQADIAIAARKELGQYRMVSVWHSVAVAGPGRGVADGAFHPTRALEILRVGTSDERPVAGTWQRVDWQPSRTGFTGKPGRFDDLAEALAYLRDRAPMGEYRVITIRRMLFAQLKSGRLKIDKKHAGLDTLIRVEESAVKPHPVPVGTRAGRRRPG